MKVSELPPLRPTMAEVNLGAIRRNVSRLRSMLQVPVIAVVKADGYGHGAVPVAEAAVAGSAEALAVATVEEGIQLRTAGLQVPILVLGWAPPAAVEPALRFGLTLTATDVDDISYIGAVARATGLPAVVHLKLDSGMGRLGLPVWDPDQLHRYRSAIMVSGVRIEGVYTHLSSADEDEEYTYRQLKNFSIAVNKLREFGLNFRWIHAANSAGAIRFPSARWNAVRIGIALYGLDPYPGAVRQLGLEPALRWRSAVAQVKTINPGIGIGYGHTVVPDQPIRIAVVAAGYGDGYDRGLSNKGEVLIKGHRIPVLGRICMDQFMVGPVPPDVRAGDEVVLIGRQLDEEITATEMAEKLDTIPYEVVTRIGPRVPRFYIDD